MNLLFLMHSFLSWISTYYFYNSSLHLQAQLDYSSPFINGSTAASSVPVPDSKYSRTSVSSPGGPSRVAPPLPPTPPPFASNQYNLPSVKTSASQPSMYNQTSIGATELSQASIASSGARLSSYPNPSMMSVGFSRSASMPLTMFGNSPNQQQTENQPSILQSISVPPASFQSMHPVTQLQPLQPPQLPRPPQPPQLLRPPVHALQQLEQGMAVQSNVQVHHQLQMLQQPQVPSMQTYYQTQQQQFSHEQQQVEYTQQPGNSLSQQQQDAAMSLHEYFKSPEAIQVFSNCSIFGRIPCIISVLARWTI